MKRIAKNTLLKVLSLNAVSVAVSFVLGVFSSKIIAVFLGTTGMALMGSFRNFAGMTKSMATLGVSNSVVKLFVENKSNPKELSAIYSTFFWIFLILAAVLGTLILAFAHPIASFLFFSPRFVLPIRFFALFLPLMVINTFWLAIYNGLEKYKRIVVIQIVSNVLVFGVTAVMIWQHRITGGLLSIAIGEVLMVLVTFIYVRKDCSDFNFDLQKIIASKYWKVIRKFSVMALLSAFAVPLTLLLIRNSIVQHYTINEAGIWDAVNRLSGFYMMLFSSGLSLYYMPKLASIHTEAEFKSELKSYFKLFVPLFFLMLVLVYFSKSLLLQLAFTPEFRVIENILIWQLAGDFIKILTLAFGFQILVKTMMKRYFAVEIIFNVSYFFLALWLMKGEATAGVVKAYFYANLITLAVVLLMFRKLFVKA